MNKQIFNKIKMEYEKRQRENAYSFDKRKNILYSKIPEIEKIDFEIKKYGIKLNRLIIIGKTEKKEKILEHIYSLKEKKINLLKINNYPLESLKKRYTCSTCKDTGFVSIGNKTKKCSCFEQLVISYLYEESNLNMTELENFDSFDDSLYSDITIANERSIKKCSPKENIHFIKNSVEKFIENFDDSSEKNLFFTGPTGSGKTFMCSCTAYELLNMGRTVLYQSSPSLFDILNEYKFKNYRDSNFDNILYSNIFSVELLIIDDLGTEFKSASRYADLLNVLNIRASKNSSKSIRKTVVSTNLNTKQLYDYYDERVASRIIGDFNIYKFFGEDLRKLKKRQNILSKNVLRSV